MRMLDISPLVSRACLTLERERNLSAGRNWRLMAARLLRPLLMVERDPLNTPAMKRPGRPGMSAKVKKLK